MRLDLLAYAGPDQVMTVTSGIASVIGVLLIFWHKVMAIFGKIANRFRGIPTTPTAPSKEIPPQSS